MWEAEGGKSPGWMGKTHLNFSLQCVVLLCGLIWANRAHASLGSFLGRLLGTLSGYMGEWLSPRDPGS